MVFPSLGLLLFRLQREVEHGISVEADSCRTRQARLNAQLVLGTLPSVLPLIA